MLKTSSYQFQIIIYFRFRLQMRHLCLIDFSFWFWFPKIRLGTCEYRFWVLQCRPWLRVKNSDSNFMNNEEILIPTDFVCESGKFQFQTLTNRWNWWIWVANLSWTMNLPATNIDDWLTLDDIDDGLVEEIWMIVEGWRRNFEDERTVIEFSIVTYLTLKVINIFTSLSPCLFMLI